MKIVKYLLIVTAAVGIFLAACTDEFLEITPTGQLGAIQLSTVSGVEGSLVGTYSMLLGRATEEENFRFYHGPENWLWGSVVGGEAHKGSNEGDQSQVNEIQAYNTQAINISTRVKYDALYEGVARANNTMRIFRGLPEGAISTADASRIEGEIRFLRAHFYFELKKIFNNTIYVDETWDETTPVANDIDLWIPIEADLKFAYDNLPETMSAAGRANKWAAGAYYAKALLFQGKYQEANTILINILQNGVTASGELYGLNDNFADAFFASNDNSKESVFAAQAAVGTGTLVNANNSMALNFPHSPSPANCCGFFQPSIEFANSFRTDANGLPLLDGSYNDPSNAVKNDYNIPSTDNFTPDEGNLDPRIDHTVGRRGIPYLDWGLHPGSTWIRDPLYGGPYSPKKFSYYLEVENDNDASSWHPGHPAVNYNIIRYADVLLWAAECAIELGDLERGKDLINMVRNRAKTSMLMEDGKVVANYVIEPYPSFSDQGTARAALRMERKLELGMEGHRFFDLVRWGNPKEVLDAYIQYENTIINNSTFRFASFTENKSEYMPIPQYDIDLVGAGTYQQNPGY
ncbi:MAG: RagB/SusD family nutrient uptake outer membrane protein [Bacteroidota bacterium]